MISLTERQQFLVDSDHPRLLALAGPGSGKTRTVVERAMRLIRGGLDPSKIALTSFTNAAANEIANRFEPAIAERIGFVGTLHSFAFNMLKEYGSAFGYGARTSIISPESAQELLAAKIKTLGVNASLRLVLEAKANGRPPRDRTLSQPELVIATYFDDLREMGVLDYDAILHEFADILEAKEVDADLVRGLIGSRFSHFVGDEVQDAAKVDWRIYRRLPIDNQLYVGDSDQSIFGFRGAAVSCLVEYAKDPSVLTVLLEDNFRSNSEICEAATRLISKNRDRIPKITKSVAGKGGFVTRLDEFRTEGEEMAAVAWRIKEIFRDAVGAPPAGSVAVLTRTNAVALNFGRTLVACGLTVAAREVDGLPGDWAAARAFLELLVNPHNDALAFFYLRALYERQGMDPKAASKAANLKRKEAAAAGISLNAHAIGIGQIVDARLAYQTLFDVARTIDVSRETLAIVADKLRHLPPGAGVGELAVAVAEVRERVKEPTGPGVHVLTMHAAKGREWDYVFLPAFEEEALPGRAARSGDENLIEEERRLAFVAVTRAKRGVFISTSSTRSSEWGGVKPRNPSRFIRDIGFIAGA